MISNLLEKYSYWLKDIFLEKGMNIDLAIFLNFLINITALEIITFLIDYLIKKIIIRVFRYFSNKTKNTFDDFLVVSNFPKFIAHSIPILIIWYSIPIISKDYPLISSFLLSLVIIFLIILGIFIFRSLLRTTKNYLQSIEQYKDKPLESYLQIFMIFAWGIGIFLIIYLLTGYSTISIASFGAVSAVILLIFKDTILGLVASIQISVNDIIRIGDWITFSRYGADGYVTKINLATVTVQNFDNSFTTIPTYSLISDSFQNWRGMQESDGRRIKRSFFIKQNSVKFLEKDNIEKLKEIEVIHNYLELQEKDVSLFNIDTEANKYLLINGKNQTNLGVFREYIHALLIDNPAINKDLYLMVRYLQPTDKGVPVEFLCFCYDKKWENYEKIQADLLDQILAAIPYFELELFESPTGKDFSALK